MIRDTDSLKQTQAAWHSVRRFQAMVKANIAGGMDGLQSWKFGDAAHSLVLIFAYAVLEDCLRIIQDEQQIATTGPSLQKLLKACKSRLPWKDFAAVEAGHALRNRIAHDQHIAPRAESWQYVDAIEAELLGWHVLDAPPQVEYAIVRGKLE